MARSCTDFNCLDDDIIDKNIAYASMDEFEVNPAYISFSPVFTRDRHATVHIQRSQSCPRLNYLPSN